MSERIYKLQKGDQVVMHTCMEHDHPDNFGKIWTCRSDEFQHKGHDYGSIFLEGFSGSFSTEFLQKVDVSALVDSFQQQMAERDQTIDLLTKQITDEVAISAKAIANLRDIRALVTAGWYNTAQKRLDEALGE